MVAATANSNVPEPTTEEMLVVAMTLVFAHYRARCHTSTPLAAQSWRLEN
jgi:hypothetical protein